MRNRQSGFTLIEIMVVVVILAVLGALVVPKILGKVDTARITAARPISAPSAPRWTCTGWIISNIRRPNKACRRWSSSPPIRPSPIIRSDGYLKHVPKDPWGNPYLYTSPGANGREYDIITYGRDGKPGGEGPTRTSAAMTLEQK